MLVALVLLALALPPAILVVQRYRRIRATSTTRSPREGNPVRGEPRDHEPEKRLPLYDSSISLLFLDFLGRFVRIVLIRVQVLSSIFC